MMGDRQFLLSVNLLYSLSDHAFIGLVGFIPVERYTVQFEWVIRWVFRAPNVVVRGFNAERAARTTNVARATDVPTYTVMADLLLSRVFRMCSGVKGQCQRDQEG